MYLSIWTLDFFYDLRMTGLIKHNFDNVFLEHGGLPHVLSCDEQVEGVIVSHSYSLSFTVRGLLHA